MLPASTENNTIIEMHNFCIQTHLVKQLDDYSWTFYHQVFDVVFFTVTLDFEASFVVALLPLPSRTAENLTVFGSMMRWLASMMIIDLNL